MTAMTQTKMMTRLLVGLLGTMTLLALNAHEASAAGFALVEQSAVAGATGGAGVARSTDPAAAWYNPAALADGGGPARRRGDPHRRAAAQRPRPRRPLG